MAKMSESKNEISKVCGATPNLFCIGGMRCGTTTLYNYLFQHPQIFFPEVKEPGFFLKQVAQEKSNRQLLTEDWEIENAKKITSQRFQTWEEYQGLYEGAENVAYRGDASHYLYHPETIDHIKKTCNESVRIVVCIRNPVERLFSEYLYQIRQGSDIRSFEEFLSAEGVESGKPMIELPSRSRLSKGLFGKLLRPWMDAFAPPNFRAVFFEDLIGNPTQTLASIFEWLAISDFPLQKQHSQRSGRPRVAWLAKLLQSKTIISSFLKKLVPRVVRLRMRDSIYKRLLKKEKMSEATRKLLADYYSSDIRVLEDVFSRDLSSWRSPVGVSD